MEESQPPAPAARFRRRGVAIVVLLAAIGGFYWYVTHHRNGAATGAVAAAPPKPPVVTVSHPLQQRIVEWDEYTGQFSAVEYVEVRSRVSGYLTEIHFEDGQIVHKGDLLFVIDPRPFEADVQQAEANLQRDQAQLVRANLDLKRYADLAQKSFASQQQLEAARATAQAGAATVKADEAALDLARLNLEFTHITAPMSGRISSHQVSIGNLVIGGPTGTTTLLTTIVSLDPIYFVFDMSEADYLEYQRAVATGELKSTRDESVPVQLKLADERDWLHDGHMDFLDNQINRGSGTIRARAIFPNPGFLMTPGQFGRARVPGSGPHEAILVPDSAIVSDQSNKIVMTVRADGTVEPRVIRPGPSYGNLRIVRRGLSADDTIIIDGLMRARPGAKVTPQPGKIVLDIHAD
ncbi:MAG TPA: efflux RND transporter periplasmic adaptor subunit [Alphaproteobacteria bacterium]|nr:efflux RND transporter periplasmic adaptor subunit [Alphaproteobacteria bacterium]